MARSDLFYRLDTIPDLELNKYAALEGNGVKGVLEQHNSFLRQIHRKGLLSGTSFHLYYYYDGRDREGKYAIGLRGEKLNIYLHIIGDEDKIGNIPELIEASNLHSYYKLSRYDFGDFIIQFSLRDNQFSSCSALLKRETFVRSSIDSFNEEMGYYTVPKWEMNEDGRLFGMTKLMESLDKRMLYRVDLYPAEKSSIVRDALRKPMAVLRERQFSRAGTSGQRDFEAENVLKEYGDLLDNLDSSPHFIGNVFAFGDNNEDTTLVLDAAGAEAIKRGSYDIGVFNGCFSAQEFLGTSPVEQYDRKRKIVLQKGQRGCILCKETAQSYALRFLPTLFTLEEIGPFFRLPALYEGETIQKKKETAPQAVPSFEIVASCKESNETKTKTIPLYCDHIPSEINCPFCNIRLGVQSEKNAPHHAIQCGNPKCNASIKIKSTGIYLGRDSHGYSVYFPLNKLSKHAFITGVPGSGKTNMMHHLTSSLWKMHRIPFLVLEPAKQEYRLLAKQQGMEELRVFAPNADMSFPLHINPFEFPKNLMVAEHIRNLCSVFEGAFPLDNPMPFLLDTAIEAVYREMGWTPETKYTEKTTLKFPTMSMLYKKLEEELNSTKYSDEVRGNLESALKVRIGSLLRREMGDVFDVPKSTIAPEEWLKIPAIIELESMGRGPSNFLTLMLCTLIRETLKVNPTYTADHARHVILIEEAHNLIGPDSEEKSGVEADPKQAATAFIVKMLAEVRALKESIIIADQLPTVMAQEIIKNTGLKIGLRITASDDRTLLGSTMAASSVQIEEMATFEPGQALISYEGIQRPFIMQSHEWLANWGTSNCGKDRINKVWCETKCPFYLQGDCVPSKESRTAINEMLSDDGLIALIGENSAYKTICERSFIIESTGLSRGFLKVVDTLETAIAHIKTLNEKDFGLMKLENRINELAKELVSEPGWETNEAAKQTIQKLAIEYSKKKGELDENYLNSPIYKRTYENIVSAISFVTQIHTKKEHWRHLGVLSGSGKALKINYNRIINAELVCKMFTAVNQMQDTVLLSVQRLYVVAAPHLSDAIKVRNHIITAINRFGAKNILR